MGFRLIRHGLTALVVILVLYSLSKHVEITSHDRGKIAQMQAIMHRAASLIEDMETTAKSSVLSRESNKIDHGPMPVSCPRCIETECRNDLIICNQKREEDISACNARCKGDSITSPPIIADTESRKVWLSIGIPTIARAGNEAYLLQTLSRIHSMLPSTSADLLHLNIIIFVVNIVQTSEQVSQYSHIRFEEAKSKYASSPYFRFHTIVSTAQPDGLPINDLGDANHPGYRVRKQSRDLAAVIRMAAAHSRYYVFAEDDMLLCTQGFVTLQYLISKAEQYHPDFIAIKASYGMNGIIMHSKDIPTFSDYLLKHQARRPPDHLIVEWFAGETDESKSYRQNRQNIGFKFNIFEHIGTVSTLRSALSGSFPSCYDLLLQPVVFAVEAYNPLDCPRDDIWPCRGQQTQSHYSLDLSSLVK